MKTSIKIFLIIFFPVFTTAQLRDYIPLMSIYSGVQFETIKLKTTGDLAYFSGGSTQISHMKLGLCAFRILDLELGGGYDFRKIKEKIPVTCINGDCPDQTNRYSQNFTINFSGRIRLFWVNEDTGDYIVYPFIKMGGVVEINQFKHSKSLYQNKWYPAANSDQNEALNYNTYTVGAEFLFDNMLMANAGVNFYHTNNQFDNSGFFTFGFGFEIGISYAIDVGWRFSPFD